MAYRKGIASWEGGLKEGIGSVSSQSGALRGSYNYNSRFGEDNTGTNPEELLGAAHAACYSMFLASVLEKAGTPAVNISTETIVLLGKDDTGPFVRKIEIITHGEIPGIEQADFQKHAETAKKNCPISRALSAVAEMTLEATLKQ